jgi:hypothetical protein
MSLEKKIKGMLAERAVLPISNMDSGDRSEVNAGSSQDPQVTELDKDISGASAAAPVAPAEAQKSIVMKGDAASVKTQAQEDFALAGETLEEAFTRKHFTAIADTIKQVTDHKVRKQMADAHSVVFKRDNPRFDQARFNKACGVDSNVVHEATEVADLKADIAGLFEGQEGLAEGFVAKATGLFEAAVIARVNAEVSKAVEKLAEQAEDELTAAKTKIEEDVNAYMAYVVEAWLKDNAVAVEAGLRNEVAESFIKGLKDLFVENYIEVPEDKVNVLESLSAELDTSKSRLNEEIEKSIALSDKIVQLEKQAVIESVQKGMVATDAERLVKLVEGVEFDSKESFAEKVSVIKETHFKAPAKKSAEVILAEQADGSNASTQVIDANVQRYVSAITRNTRF